MVTGTPPFAADSMVATLRKATLDSPPDPRTLRPELPQPAEAALLRALEKEPARRFASAGGFALAFVRGLQGKSLTPSPQVFMAEAGSVPDDEPLAAPGVKRRHHARRWRVAVLIALPLAVLLVAVAVLTVGQGKRLAGAFELPRQTATTVDATQAATMTAATVAPQGSATPSPSTVGTPTQIPNGTPGSGGGTKPTATVSPSPTPSPPILHVSSVTYQRTGGQSVSALFTVSATGGGTLSWVATSQRQVSITPNQGQVTANQPGTTVTEAPAVSLRPFTVDITAQPGNQTQQVFIYVLPG